MLLGPSRRNDDDLNVAFCVIRLHFSLCTKSESLRKIKIPDLIFFCHSQVQSFLKKTWLGHRKLVKYWLKFEKVWKTDFWLKELKDAVDYLLDAVRKNFPPKLEKMTIIIIPFVAISKVASCQVSLRFCLFWDLQLAINSLDWQITLTTIWNEIMFWRLDLMRHPIKIM